MDMEKIINIIISLTVFGLAFSVWCIGIFLWLGRYLSRLKTVQKRLGISSEFEGDSDVLRLWRDMQIQREAEYFTVEKKAGFRKRFKRWLQDSGLDISPGKLLLGLLGLLLVAFMIGYSMTTNLWVGVCAAVTILFVFVQYMQNLIVKRANLFERQLVDALGVAARALRAGHPLVGAFQLIAEEIGDPLGSIFGQIYQQQAFGSDLRESIRQSAKEAGSVEFKLFATAVSVQLQSGGNLADLMDSLASVVRARIRLNKRIRVLTAQTQFSKVILIAMPIVMFMLLNIINPVYMAPLYETPHGKILLFVIFIMILTGYWLMNKMIKINY